MASSVANHVIMRTSAVGVSSEGSPASVANDVIIKFIAGLVAGCERRRREPRE